MDTSAAHKVGLALSGGGFRATLFHLGVVLALRDANILKRVTHISGVSGGSILAAFLVSHWRDFAHSNWASPEFQKKATELLDFTRQDLAGRIIRRWPRPRTLLLEESLGELLENQTLGGIASGDGPLLFVLATNLTTRKPCCFSSVEGGRWLRDVSTMIAPAQEDKGSFAAVSISLARAVASSAAYPPIFPEVCLSFKEFNTTELLFGSPEYFVTDGGVYDNSGLTIFRALSETDSPDVVVCSDARRIIDLSKAGKTGFMGMTRPGALMGCYETATYTLETLAETELACHLELTKRTMRVEYLRLLDQSSAAQGTLDPSCRAAIRNVRTDFDAFSDEVRSALVLHGYAVASEKMKSLGRTETSERLTPNWGTIGILTADAIKVSAFKNSAKTRIRSRLFSFRDRASWPYAILAVVVVGVLLFVFALPYLKQTFPSLGEPPDFVRRWEWVNDLRAKGLPEAEQKWLTNALQDLSIEAQPELFPGLQSDPQLNELYERYGRGKTLHAFVVQSPLLRDSTKETMLCSNDLESNLPLHVRAFFVRKATYQPLEVRAAFTREVRQVSLDVPAGRKGDYILILIAVVLDKADTQLVQRTLREWRLCK